MGTDTLYIKKANGRYVEAGIYTQVDLYPGIWMVQKTEGSTSMSSIHLGDLPTISSLVEVVQARRIAEIIMERLKPLWDAEELRIYNHSFFEVQRMMAQAIVDYVNKGRQEAIDGDYDSAKASGMKLAHDTLNEIMNPSEKNTWHGCNLSRLELLFTEINDIGHRKVGTHEFAWYITELKRLLKERGFDIKDNKVGGMIINPETED